MTSVETLGYYQAIPPGCGSRNPSGIRLESPRSGGNAKMHPMSRTALRTSEKPAESNAKQAANERSEAKNNSAKKAFLNKLEPHIQAA
jgi:hypothetical protein